MNHEQPHRVILTRLEILAITVYPNRPELQAQFKIGFLTAQLAHAWLEDSHNYSYFKHSVNALGFTQATK